MVAIGSAGSFCSRLQVENAMFFNVRRGGRVAEGGGLLNLVWPSRLIPHSAIHSGFVDFSSVVPPYPSRFVCCRTTTLGGNLGGNFRLLEPQTAEPQPAAHTPAVEDASVLAGQAGRTSKSATRRFYSLTRTLGEG